MNTVDAHSSGTAGITGTGNESQFCGMRYYSIYESAPYWKKKKNVDIA